MTNNLNLHINQSTISHSSTILFFFCVFVELDLISSNFTGGPDSYSKILESLQYSKEEMVILIHKLKEIQSRLENSQKFLQGSEGVSQGIGGRSGIGNGSKRGKESEGWSLSKLFFK